MRHFVALTTVSVAALAAPPALADTASRSGAAAAELAEDAPKKWRYVAQNAAKDPDAEERAAWQRELDERVGETPPELINIRNLWMEETLAIPRDPDLEVGQDISREVVNQFLRCRFTDEPADMDARLVGVLVRAAERFDAERVEVISAFRSEKHNVNLRKKGDRVARNSQHTQAAAVDFRVPGVPTSRLHRWARSLRLGGVGYYPNSGFVHVDTARVRYWTAR